MEKTLVGSFENGYIGIVGVIVFLSTDDHLLPHVRSSNFRRPYVHGRYVMLPAHIASALGRVSKQIL